MAVIWEKMILSGLKTNMAEYDVYGSGKEGECMIKFGTDGWRGVISDDFTFHNLRLVAMGIAQYVRDRGEEDKGIVVGYDSRFLSAAYAKACGEVLVDRGIRVWLSDSGASAAR